MDDAPQRRSTYWLTRFLFLRLVGLVYFIAFLCAWRQFLPLGGEHGLLPAQSFLQDVRASQGPALAFWKLPTLFWLDASDAAFVWGAGIGVASSLAVVLGFANVPLMAALWALYMSFVHVGQIFYGYGWEVLLLETGFLAIFLAPAWRPWPFLATSPPAIEVMWLLRWLVFRLMFGAGLIKMRGDPCWRDLTCMVYHYETQPIPNPLSLYLHHLPVWFHAVETAFNHVVELVVPFFLFGPRRARHLAGALTILFQALLILSGNLSFLNWLTIAIAIGCFDDGLLRRIVPGFIGRRVDALPADAEPSTTRRTMVRVLMAVIALLSLNPVANMLSPRQAMNASFDPFDLVNTYGAFGSVGRERNEIVLQGTDDDPASPVARWVAYELPCKPGDVARRPCITSPYHRRLDWQMWFAAMSSASNEPWLIHLVAKLLEGDRGARSLFARPPFEDQPPRYIRAQLYRYQFAPPGGPVWWHRELLGDYLPPLSRSDPRLEEYLSGHGWKD
jgi:hypothetical protein